MNGILLVDKPAGWTSHDVVAKVRGILHRQASNSDLSSSHLDVVQGSSEEWKESYKEVRRLSTGVTDAVMRQKSAGVALPRRGQQGKTMRKVKVGHTGTLDPFATGLLILVVGSYTKRAAEFSKLDKTYEAEVVLGSVSTTGDPEGEITKKSDKKPSEEEVMAVLEQFKGKYMQMPPSYSAKKINGQRAYKLAREGKEVKLEPVEVEIYDITDVVYDFPRLSFTVSVSSGTYIRTLAEDIGEKLGTGAYLSALRRTKIGKFDISSSVDVSHALDAYLIKV
ncbi:tRNA pseudouridine(55) synthase TruB [Candidatus Saccharibacteria bacterium]|nr:tRNA pseudouridine(55) synthase TruB [Candidatus Saccharibacteria bacterium]